MNRRAVHTALFMVALATAVVYAARGVRLADADAVGAYGLVSALPAMWYVSIAVITASLAIAVHTGAGDRILWAHLGVFVFVVQASPAVLYGSARYAWAWKHVGVIDYLQRTGVLWTDAPDLAVYHNWPGFFTAVTTLTDAAGLDSASPLATWAPVFFGFANAGAAVVLLRSLTADRRVVWLGAWLFVIANWVGQDYFAPQAFAFALYLLVVAVLLRYFRSDATTAPTGATRSALLVVVLFLCQVIVVSHPLTPIMLTTVLTALVAFRVLVVRWLPVVVGALTLAWWATGAADFVRREGRSLLGELGAVAGNVQSTAATHRLDAAQHVVAIAGRAVVIVVVVLAAGGLWRRRRHRVRDRAPAILALAPVLMFVGGSYGGEAVFRTYLFALPFLAFFAASLLYPAASTRTTRTMTLATFGVSAALLVGFMFAHFGKDAWYHFTPGEISAAEVVYGTAPPGSLLVEGSTNYPNRFENYERFTYVSIADEPPEAVSRLLRDPATTLYEWLSDPRYSGGYVIITRAQKIENDAVGPLPPGALARVEAALWASDRFTVLVANPSASVFTLAKQSAEEQV